MAGAPTDVVELITAADGARPRLENVTDIVPIDDATFVVSLIGWHKWAYKRGGEFRFALMDTDGKLLGRLDLDVHRDSAARGMRYDVVADPARRRLFHLNTFGLYVFDASGARTAVLPTADKEYKPLAPFQLRGFDTSGCLVLVHEKQHLVLTVPVPDDLAGLPGAVTDALALFRKERTRVKKQESPQNWYWTAGEDVPLTVF